ncbi:MAG: hypothetical protein IJZ44_07465 [Lachnospiraceae bacterium]|nr:hypothetical protein [Lachnospiraceae bacterium]
MKKKIYTFTLLLALIFIIGCNKQKEYPIPTPIVETTATVTPTPTSTPTPSPTPIPENLAKTNLKKLPELFDQIMSYSPQNTVDYSKGVGYDINIKFSIGSQIAELLGISDLKNISIDGTMDAKDTIAANLDFCLNDEKITNAHLFADSENLLFNLPAYSSNYALTTWEELMNSLNETETDTEELRSSLPDNSKIISTLNVVDKNALPSDEELINTFKSCMDDFIECFVEVPGITEHASIGTGDYLMTGEKHTVSANINELIAVLERLETELQVYYGDLNFGLDSLETDGATTLFLDYYTNGADCYAWAAYPDNSTSEPFVYINTPLGFCLYRVEEDGTETLGMYSVKSSEKAGTITLAFGEEEPIGTVDYEYSDNSISIYAVLDTLELTMEYSKTNDTIRYNATVLMDGVSVVIKETVTPTRTDVSASLASYGMEYLTMSVSTSTRDYVEIPVPTNYVDMNTWAEGLDQETLMADLMALMQKYPSLMSLFGGSEEEEDGEYSDDEFWDEDDTRSETEPFTLPEDYTDDFMGMTGYAVDSDGYVDFYPVEDEVLAAGKPSTGYDTLALSDDQKQQLFTIAETAIPNCEKDTYSFYWIWGGIQYNDVQSYYSMDYEFNDPNNWDNSITISLDPISGEFISVDIYYASKEDALRIANEMFAVLGGTYTITDKMVEEYAINEDGFSFSGYDGTEYGSNYYNVGISLDYDAPIW